MSKSAVSVSFHSQCGGQEFDPPLLHHYFQQFTAAGNGGCFGQVANTWTFFLEFNCTASTAARLLSSTVLK
jgi:hypothetical protein